MNNFDQEWELQQGSLMLKSTNNELEWKKQIAWHFWGAGVQGVYARPEIKKLTDKEYDSQKYWMREGILEAAGQIMRVLGDERAAGVARHLARQMEGK